MEFLGKGLLQNRNKCDFECNKAFQTDEYLDTKNCSNEKQLIGKFALACEDGILNATGNSLYDEKIICNKINYLICTIPIVITTLLLFFVGSIVWFYY